MKQTAQLSVLLSLLLLTAGCKRDDPDRLKAVGRTIGAKVGAVLNRSNDRHRKQMTDYLLEQLEARPDLVAA